MNNKIHEKGTRNNPLTEAQKESNRKKSKTRARVEHVFGFIEGSMNRLQLNCIGIKRASAMVSLINLTYNRDYKQGCNSACNRLFVLCNRNILKLPPYITPLDR